MIPNLNYKIYISMLILVIILFYLLNIKSEHFVPTTTSLQGCFGCMDPVTDEVCPHFDNDPLLVLHTQYDEDPKMIGSGYFGPSMGPCSIIQEGTSKTLIIQDGTEEIQALAFGGGHVGFIKNIILPDTLTKIGEEAFAYSSLTSITIPNNVTSIGNYAFEECEELENVTLGTSLQVIGEGAFYGCPKLKEIIIPDSVTVIHDYAFKGCEQLKSIVIPENVAIGTDAFSNIGCGTEITITEGVEICNCELKRCTTSARAINIDEDVIDTDTADPLGSCRKECIQDDYCKCKKCCSENNDCGVIVKSYITYKDVFESKQCKN